MLIELFTTGLAALLAHSSGPARSPSDPSIETQVQVSYSDLDLTTPVGRARLRRRVNEAARDLCSALDSVVNTSCRKGVKRRSEPLVREAIAAARADHRTP